MRQIETSHTFTLSIIPRNRQSSNGPHRSQSLDHLSNKIVYDDESVHLRTSRPVARRGYSTCTSFEYIESRSRACKSMVNRRKQKHPQLLTIVVRTGSSSVSTPEYLNITEKVIEHLNRATYRVSTLMPPTVWRAPDRDAPPLAELPIFPERTGLETLPVFEGGANWSGSLARPFPLSGACGDCIDGWVNPGILSSSKSSSSSGERNKRRSRGSRLCVPA